MKDKPIIKRLKINGVNYFRDFEITFNNSCKILIGDNGVGKTTILNILFSILTQRWLFLTQCPFDHIELELKRSDKISFSHAELDAFIIASNSEIADKSYGILENEVKKFSKISHILNSNISKDRIIYLPTYRKLREELHIFRKHFSQSFQDTEIGSVVDEFNSIGNEILIPDGLSYLESHSFDNKKRQDNFLQSCNSFLVNTKLQPSISKDGLELINKFSNEKVPLSQLSSGEKQIIYTLSRLYLNNHSSLVFLFDEPELSLALPWQRLILPEIVKSGYCEFLLAITHSPFVFDNELDEYAEGINLYLK